MAMNSRILAVITLMSVLTARSEVSLPTFENFKHNTIIQDPQSKISYYVESDRRHVAAINPAGSVLWCSEVIPAEWTGKMFILKIDFETAHDGSDKVNRIGVRIWMGGQGGGWLDKKTGVYTHSEQTL